MASRRPGEGRYDAALRCPEWRGASRRNHRRGAGTGFRRYRRDATGFGPGGGQTASHLGRGRTSWRHGLDGRPVGLAGGSDGAVARGAVRDPVGRALHPRDRPDGSACATRPRGNQRLCPGQGLSRRGQEAAEEAGALADRPRRRSDQGLCRYRTGDGEAAGRGCGSWLAGQAHKPGVARARVLVLHRRNLHDAGAGPGPAT